MAEKTRKERLEYEQDFEEKKRVRNALVMQHFFSNAV